MESWAQGMVFIIFEWISSVHAKCPQIFLEHNNSCYFWGTNRVTNVERAFASCQAFGGYLLNIESQPEMDFIADTIQKQQLRFDGYWTGGYFNGQNWEWQATAERDMYVTLPIREYTNWAVREPNDVYTRRWDRYLVILANDAEPFKWYSESHLSNRSLSYICEREK